jgi:hypothetical protein
MTGPPSLRPTLLLVLLVVAAATVPPVGGSVRADTAPGGAFTPPDDALAARDDAFTANASSRARTASSLAEEPSGRFGDRVVSAHRGDVIEIGITDAKNHRVVLGSDDTGFRASFRVSSGGAKVRLNTYKAGHSGYPVDEAVRAESGSITDVQVQPGSIDQPLETGRYPMNVSFNGTESDVGSFLVTERSTNYSSGWAVPEGFSVDEDTTVATVAEAGENRTNNLSLARGDWLALEVNASGLYGILEKGGLDGDDGIHVELVQRNPPPNHDPNTFEGDRAAHFRADPGNDRFFLLVDTRRHGIEPGHVYNATFRLTPESGLVEREENLTTTFRVNERESQVFYRGRKLVANASGATTVAGNATMVAGTTFQIRAKNTGEHPFLETRTVRLDDESAFEATFDFGPYPPGTNFTISIPETGLTVPAVVGERETATPTPTPVTTRTATPTPTPTPTPALTYATNTPLAARTVTGGDGQPGFGFVGPAVAVLAVAALARRRRWGA